MIRTCGNTILAAYTVFLVDQDNPVFSFVRCARGTNGHTGWIVAMLALDWKKLPVEIGELPKFPLLKIIVGFILPQMVLILTGDAAGITADAFRLIYDHPVFCHSRLFTPFSPAR
jgi:hypothetical protein